MLLYRTLSTLPPSAAPSASQHIHTRAHTHLLRPDSRPNSARACTPLGAPPQPSLGIPITWPVLLPKQGKRKEKKRHTGNKESVDLGAERTGIQKMYTRKQMAPLCARSDSGGSSFGETRFHRCETTRMVAQRLAGGEESLHEAVAGGVALHVVGVDVEGERNDGVAAAG